MSNSTASITSPSDFVVLTTQTVNNVPKQGIYPIYVRGASKCCIDKSEIQQITPVVIPVK
jgi:hypothetical protein